MVATTFAMSPFAILAISVAFVILTIGVFRLHPFFEKPLQDAIADPCQAQSIRPVELGDSGHRQPQRPDLEFRFVGFKMPLHEFETRTQYDVVVVSEGVVNAFEFVPTGVVVTPRVP